MPQHGHYHNPYSAPSIHGHQTVQGGNYDDWHSMPDRYPRFPVSGIGRIRTPISRTPVRMGFNLHGLDPRGNVFRPGPYNNHRSNRSVPTYHFSHGWVRRVGGWINDRRNRR